MLPYFIIILRYAKLKNYLILSVTRILCISYIIITVLRVREPKEIQLKFIMRFIDRNIFVSRWPGRG